MSVSKFPSTLSGIFNSSDFISSGTLSVSDAKAMFVSLNNNNELTGSQIFDASITLKSIPRTDIARESEITDDKCLVTKKYADTSVSGCALLASNNTYTGTNTFNSNLTVANTFTASTGGISLTLLPRLQWAVTPSDSKDLSTKQYTDDAITTSLTGLVASKSDTICYGQQVVEYASTGGSYIIEAPTLGTSTTGNSYGYYLGFNVNFPATSSGLTLLQNSVMFDLNYYYYKAPALTGATSSSGNKATVPSFYSNMSLSALTGTSGLVDISARFSVTIKNNSLLVHCLQQTTTIWTNPTTTSNSQTAFPLTSTYAGSQSMQHNVINFQYVNTNSFQISIGYPNQVNNPTVSGWISNLGFSCKLLTSNPCTSAVFGSTTPLATPNTKSNTLTGGAYFGF